MTDPDGSVEEESPEEPEIRDHTRFVYDGNSGMHATIHRGRVHREDGD